jgi:hypothetical protein
MDLRISTDVFRRRGRHSVRIDPDQLGAEAHVALPPAFVTGLRDWRRTPAISARQSAHAADGEWQPL